VARIFYDYIGQRLHGSAEEALHSAEQGVMTEPEIIRKLDHRARTVLALFAQHEQITVAQIAASLGIAIRTARTLAQAWVDEGWLVVMNTSNRKRTYGLSAVYRPFIGKDVRQQILLSENSPQPKEL